MTRSVVAVFFESQAHAGRILHALPDNGELIDAALLLESEAGRLKLSVSDRPSGGVLEAIFPPSVLALRATGREADRARNHFIDEGFQQNLLKEIGENLPPGGAALVAVVDETWLTGLREKLESSVGFERYPIEAEAPEDEPVHNMLHQPRE